MAPLLWWVRGGGGVGGPPPRPPPGLCGGGGVGWAGPFGPLAMPLVGRMLAQALAGALTSPAVAARRRPAGGGRGG